MIVDKWLVKFYSARKDIPANYYDYHDTSYLFDGSFLGYSFHFSSYVLHDNSCR